MSVSNNVSINDIRTQFKSNSFSNYKKTEVKKQLIDSMKREKIEPACYWSAELICAGHFIDLWDIIIHYFGKHIHLGNPKIIIYLERRYRIFYNIISQGYYQSELELRNNQNIRKLFAEIIYLLTFSHKKHSFEQIKINANEEFNLSHMTELLKADSMNYVENIYKPKDPKELFISFNEFAYFLSKNIKNTTNACYWIEWILEFDALCKRKKNPCYCEKRNDYNVENKHKCDIIWIIWDILMHYCNLLENPFLTRLMDSTISLFCIKYTNSCNKKRRYLLYFAVSIITENVNVNGDMVNDNKRLEYIVDKIDDVYKQIKKNECSPNTDYLFSNLEKSDNFEKSIRKMEIMNKMTEII